MSYTSESEVSGNCNLLHLQEFIQLLGYQKVHDNLRVPDRVASYYWYDKTDYRSWVGVELDIFDVSNSLIITTRSRSGRSYWDLVHQNGTLKSIRDFFGGHFTTDAGRNRYWRPDQPPPSPISSGCFIARWRFHNAVAKADIYLMSREFKGDIAKDKPSGFNFMDDFNPRLLSNNFLLPYIVAVWEDYFRSTFAAAFKYSAKRESTLKNARLNPDHLEQIANGTKTLETVVAESFSFQRPSQITGNFRLLDPKLDIGGALRKPYRRRKTSLYDSIEAVIEDRNAFVHEGNLNLSLFDKMLKAKLKDIVEAVDRSYTALGDHFNFVPILDY